MVAPILITGGLGFLGSHLASRFSASGEAIRILARPERRAEVQDCPHEIVWGDIRDPEAVERAARGVEVVVHTVSNFRKGGSDEREAHEVNVEGTKNVIAACRKAGVQQLIHCSTIGVHGSVLEIPADEESPFNPLDLYQETKLRAEQEVWKAYRETGLPVTVIRPISIFGPGDLRMLKLFRMIQKGRFVMVGDGQALFQPAYIDDVVDGFQLSLRNPKAIGEAFIVGGEEYVPLSNLVDTIASELRVPAPRWRLPLGPVLMAADLCERIFVPLKREPPLHRRRVSFFQNNRAFSVRKAKEILGFHPQMGLRDSLRATIGWYRERGWL
ncbi:MAG TPA: NAD-dependent epimerase/dehydratase family protein [Thermoanaerobaculia bacterium]|nr:NAD-dependent epimerase/dehydratase family protein [Thermoanaerobaculia bacterium]